MLSRSKTRWSAAALGLGVMLSSLPATADGTTKVKIVLIGLDPGGTPVAAFDHHPPASKEFTVEIRVGDLKIADTVAVSGKIDIWPEAGQPRGLAPEGECAKRPPNGGDQHHTLGLALSGTVPDRVLSATVPPLQVGQKFCFALDIHPALSETQMDQAAIAASASIAPVLLRAPECSAAATPELFEWGLRDALGKTLGVPVARRADVRVAAGLASSAFLAAGPSACGNAQNIIDLLEQKRADLEALRAIAGAARAKLAQTPPPASVTDPFVLVNGAPTLAGTLAAEETAAPIATLRQAAADLLRRGGAGTAYGAWSAALTKLAEDLDQPGLTPENKKKAYQAAAAVVKKLHESAGVPLEIAKGDGLIPYSTYKSAPESVSPSRVAAQLAQLDRPGVVPAAEQPKLKELKRVVEAFQITRENLAGAETALIEGIGKRDDLVRKLEAKIQEVLKGTAVRANLEGAVTSVTLSDGAGTADTPNQANYVSLDLGVVLGAPTGGQKFQPWLMPYTGFTFYFTAVDRTVPIDQLVGHYGQYFRQRFSLTLGMTLTSPSIPGRDTTTPLGFGNYPLVAAGWRLTHFVRLTAGAAFYRVSDPNPASADSFLRVAPFIGGSLDADVVHALQKL